jgi:hypothetical protein
VTPAGARRAANLVLLSAGVAAAAAVVANPPLRRLVWAGMRYWLGATIPVYLMSEARAAWKESGRRAVA